MVARKIQARQGKVEVVEVVGKSVKDVQTESLSKNIPQKRHLEIWLKKAWYAKKAYMKKPLSLHGGYTSTKLANFDNKML